MLKTLAKDSVPGAKALFNGDLGGKEDSDSEAHTGGVAATPFNRLNQALDTLKKEMASLRHLDMSLFCQLLSLNEAIQEFKISMQDRYSEYTGSEYTGSEYNGSEYSYGGMGSRTGSFSSLIEESDWNTDFRMNYDDPNSPSSAAEGINDMGEITASASSLMQQIEALALRADADFSL
ncbi:hypothetical protein C0Q70_14190 [Pomacea canaliculata]|uniref:Uncharacterized protein n=1 Tax=Pomacea canaliculata TaxID=400727 RepID=A0A2T7NZE4_POMCA|nr:hypothetical protein C0Q70_14190 [Pomacea canaliculata]